jgi:mannose-6-phosphate isomerase-like protein (cupin superfamily)
MGKVKQVFRIADVPFIESPDGIMRDSVMITDETCGSEQFSAGLFFVRPGGAGHADTHEGIEEVFYIIQGQANIEMDGEDCHVKAGDVVFVPAGVAHKVINTGDEQYIAFWLIGAKYSDLPDIQEELGKWPEIEPKDDWGPLPS